MTPAPESPKLEACAHCGGEGVVMERTCNPQDPYNPADRAFPVVRCTVCFAQACGEDWQHVSTAIEAWNRRPAPTASPAPMDEVCRLITLWWETWVKMQGNPEHWRDASRFMGFLPERLREAVGDSRPALPEGVAGDVDWEEKYIMDLPGYYSQESLDSNKADLTRENAQKLLDAARGRVFECRRLALAVQSQSSTIGGLLEEVEALKKRFRPIIDGYNFTIHTETGELFALTAGDHGYEGTGIMVDLEGITFDPPRAALKPVARGENADV